jgi:hypothetical protein
MVIMPDGGVKTESLRASTCRSQAEGVDAGCRSLGRVCCAHVGWSILVDLFEEMVENKVYSGRAEN